MLIPLHGIASRHDLPLPFSFVVVGAALALAISFVVLLLAWREPTLRRAYPVARSPVTKVVDHPGVRRSRGCSSSLPGPGSVSR